jgi:hypothetical protein
VIYLGRPSTVFLSREGRLLKNTYDPPDSVILILFLFITPPVSITLTLPGPSLVVGKKWKFHVLN